ncbi:MAG TPA: hypothetical protein VGR63_19130 [Casimicrobiaceae bacterium]|jgi:hypothetical protein|nr:hypothetical protein [Casimicrobiaceae bacterium]
MEKLNTETHYVLKKDPSVRVITADFIRVDVTQNIINSAAPSHSARCFAALSVKELGASSIRVTKDTIAFNLLHLRERRVYTMPAIAALHIEQFDTDAEKYGPEVARANQKPFSFILQRPAKAEITRIASKRGPDKEPRKRQANQGVRFCVRRSRGHRIIEVKPE